MSNLRRGNLGKIALTLNLGAMDDWEFTSALRLSNACPPTGNAIVHYDFWRTIGQLGEQDFAGDPVFDDFPEPGQVVVITCVASSAVLRKRLRGRLPRYVRAKLRALVLGGDPELYSPLKQARFLDQAKLSALYQAWLSFCLEAQFLNHWKLYTDHFPSIERVRDRLANSDA